MTADLEGGYGDPGGTVARAIDIGIVGANLEDQMKPLDASVRAVEAAVEAGEKAGVPFALNARTDAFLKAGDRDPEEVITDAVARGKAYLEAGATSFFVPGLLDGPWSQNTALTALAVLAEDVYAGGGLPADVRKLN